MIILLIIIIIIIIMKILMCININNVILIMCNNVMWIK